MPYACHDKAHVSKNTYENTHSDMLYEHFEFNTLLIVTFSGLVFLHLNSPLSFSSSICAKGRIIVCGRGEEVKWKRIGS